MSINGTLNKEHLNYIKEVVGTCTYIEDNNATITIRVWTTYNVQEEYRIAIVNADNVRTFINGKEKEYKNRKCALNAILKAYSTLDKYNELMSLGKELKTNINIDASSEIKAEDNREDETATIKTTVKNDTYKNNRIKINMLDNKVNRLLDAYMSVKHDIDKQGIKYNDRTNELIIELNRLDKEMNEIENRIDILKEDNRKLYSINYNKEVNELKNKYIGKYKVVNRETKETIYTNNIKEYLYNTVYNIYMLIEDREVAKQEYRVNNKYTSWLDKDVLKVFYYKNDDAINNIEKTETYYNNILIAKEIDKTKRKVHFLYTYIKDNIEDILYINTDNYNNYIDTFKDDKEIIDILETYKVPHASEKKIKADTNYIETLEYYINKYEQTVNKFQKLKIIAENLEYYNNKYKVRYKDLFRKYKTNRSNLSNYLNNYRTLMKLKSIDKSKCKNKKVTEYSFQIPYRVNYTKHYKAIN